MDYLQTKQNVRFAVTTPPHRGFDDLSVGGMFIYLNVPLAEGCHKREILELRRRTFRTIKHATTACVPSLE